MFCVECGNEDKLYEGLCSECFLRKRTFLKLPKNIDVELCAHCGVRRKGKGWIRDDDGDTIEKVILENAEASFEVSKFDVHLNCEYEDENNVKVKVISHAKVHDLKVEEHHDVKIRFKKNVCDECSKQQGGYWEAKVQVRGSKSSLLEEDKDRAFDIVDLMVAEREKKDKDAFITKIEEIHSGLDFYFGSKSLGKAIAKKLASDFGGTVKESGELVGRRDGKDIYRMTYSVRLSDFRISDFIMLDEQIFQVKKISSDGILLRALESHKDMWFSPSDLQKAKHIGGVEMIKEMVVVSKGENEIQVLDPDNLKTVDVLLPIGSWINGDSVAIVKCEAGYFYIENR